MKHILGLENEGNTCYINSVLQLLCSSKPIIKYVIDNKKPKKIARFVKNYFNNTNTINPTKLLKTIPFDNSSQHDAHEFLMYIVRNFKGIFTVKGTLNKQKFKEKILSVTIEKNLHFSIQNFLEPNGKIHIWPTCLFIHFKRYGEMYYSPVEVPFEWRIMQNNVIKKYELKGFIIHFGDSEGDHGHYVTILIKDKDYFMCNDEQITNISKSDVIGLLKHSYILLYQLNN